MSRVVLVVRIKGESACFWQDEEGRYRVCRGDESLGVEDFKRHEADPSTIAVNMYTVVFKALEKRQREIYGWPEPVVKEGPIFTRAMCLHPLGPGKARVYWKDAEGEYRKVVCSFQDAKNFQSLQDRFRTIESRTKAQSPDTYPELLPIEVLSTIQEREFAAMGLTKTYEGLASRRLRLRQDDRSRRKPN